MGHGGCADNTGIQDPMTFTLKRMHEDSDAAVESSSTGTTRRKGSKGSRGKTSCGSEDEINICRSLRHRPWISYQEFESSSEDEYDPKVNDKTQSSGLPVGVSRGCASCEECQKVLARWRPEGGRRPVLEEAPVFFPLEEEFRDTMKYIASISAEAEKYGICRIVPPYSWRPPCPLRDSEKRQNVMFATKVQQIDKLQVREAQVKSTSKKRRRGRRPRKAECIKQKLSISEDDSSDDESKFGFEPGPIFSLKAFEKYANDFKEAYFADFGEQIAKQDVSIESIEGEYWRIVEQPTEQMEVLYGADIETQVFGSGFPKLKPEREASLYELSGWNLNNIARLPGSILSFEEEEISGVHRPWLYVGMCFSSFCWHVEDHYFYSLNYMHFGSPKVWYGVPSSGARIFEEAMRHHLPHLFKEQPDLLHKLVTQLSPSILRASGVPIYRAVQRAGEFVVTFPRAYHAGFNCGFNCAEAVNVAPIDWLPFGQNAVELYKEQRRKSSVSHDKLLLGAVKQALRSACHGLQDRNDAVDNVWQELLAQYGIVLKVLKNRVDLERVRRFRIANTIQTRKMDTSFDAVDARECPICHYDLHLSAIGCSCCPEQYACLEHAQELCPCDWTMKYALYRYEVTELEDFVAALEGSTKAVINSEQREKSELPKHLIWDYNVSNSPNGVVMENKSVYANSKMVNQQHLEKPAQIFFCNEIFMPVGVKGSQQSSQFLSHSEKRPNSKGSSKVIVLSDDEDDVDAHGNLRCALTSNGLNKDLRTSADSTVHIFGKSLNICKSDDAFTQLLVGYNTAPQERDLTLELQQQSSNETAPPKLFGSLLPGTAKDAGDRKWLTLDSCMTPASHPSGYSLVRGVENSTVVHVARFNSSGCAKPQLLGPKVELLKTGQIVTRKAWCNNQAIFPAGFQSRVMFPSFLDPFKSCFYISEIIENVDADPLFKVVMEDYPGEVFIDSSIERCWQKVQERVNMTIRLWFNNEKVGSLFVRAPEDVRGLELFGFTCPHIIEAIESLDCQHQCVQYWIGRFSAAELPENQWNFWPSRKL